MKQFITIKPMELICQEVEKPEIKLFIRKDLLKFLQICINLT